MYELIHSSHPGSFWRRIRGLAFCIILFSLASQLAIGRVDALVTDEARPVASIYGAIMTIKPTKGRLEVAATITNRGRHTVILFTGRRWLGWRLRAFDGGGRPLRSALPPLPRAGPRLIYLRPGHSLSRRFDIAGWPELRSPGGFYFYAQRWVLGAVGVKRGRGSPVLASPILRLILRKGKTPLWKAASAVPRLHYRPPPLAPPFPAYKVPRRGPIATLAGISQAVHSGDLNRVRQLCFSSGGGHEPFYVADAEEAVALARMCRAVGARFGPVVGARFERGLARTHPSPEGFTQLVAELDPHTLKIDGKRASVGILYWQKGKFVPTGNLFCFRLVKGQWLLDSRATLATSYFFRRDPGLYARNVAAHLSAAHAFDGLARALAGGRFATLAEFRKALRSQLVAQSRRFLVESMKNNKQWLRANAWLSRNAE